jgi:hypothetical protein
MLTDSSVSENNTGNFLVGFLPVPQKIRQVIDIQNNSPNESANHAFLILSELNKVSPLRHSVSPHLNGQALVQPV